MRQQQSEFSARGAEIIVVGPEDSKAFEKYFRSQELPFIGIPDSKLTVLGSYGQEFKLLKLGRMPASVIVDRAGVIRFVSYGESMRDIPKNEELFAVLDGLA